MIEPIPEFAAYLQWDRVQLLNRLAVVQYEIAGWHLDLAFAKETETRQRATAWLESNETSVQARDRQAQWASLEAKITAAEIEAKIAARVEEKFFLLRLLDADST